MERWILFLILLFVFIGCAHKQTDPTMAEAPPSNDTPQTNDVPANAANPPAEETTAQTVDKHSPREVIDAMNAVREEVLACGNGTATGIVKVKFRILETGAIESVEAIEDFAGTEIGVCIEKAVMKAKFRATGAPTNITFPFKLGDPPNWNA